jgi:hypothetical protein
MVLSQENLIFFIAAFGLITGKKKKIRSNSFLNGAVFKKSILPKTHFCMNNLKIN